MPNKLLVKTEKPSFLAVSLADWHVAAMRPSSPFLVNRLLKRMGPKTASAVVELGPGDGVATRAVLNLMPTGSRYLAIELNREFASHLAGWDDPRLMVVHDDARNLRPILDRASLGPLDAVIASIPFTYLGAEERRRLVVDACAALKPGGRMIVFHQHTPIMAPYLKEAFGRVRTEFELMNFLPCWMMTAVKV